MDFVTIVNWCAVGVALTGAFFNIRSKWYGFVFWMASNTWWAIHHIRHNEWPQSITFTLFLFLAIYGIRSWRKDEAKITNKQFSRLLHENTAMHNFIKSIPEKKLKKLIRKN